MRVDFFAHVVGDAALRDVAVEVLVPRLTPLELLGDGECLCSRVVRAVEHVGGDRDARPLERADDPVVLGHEEHAADVEEHRCRS